jgi:hypothetical protein
VPRAAARVVEEDDVIGLGGGAEPALDHLPRRVQVGEADVGVVVAERGAQDGGRRKPCGDPGDDLDRDAAEADYVVLLYNPRSRARHWQLDRSLDLLREHRPPDTPVGVVRDASRPGQTAWTAALAHLDTGRVDMSCLVVVGASTTRLVDGLLVTPRGYSWKGRS